jgi:hypothetical protein
VVEAQRVGEGFIKNMTSYANEEDFLKDQIRSNNLAIKFIKGKLGDLKSEFQEDHISTKDKIMNVYLQGIEALKEDSELKKERIKALDHYN